MDQLNSNNVGVTENNADQPKSDNVGVTENNADQPKSDNVGVTENNKPEIISTTTTFKKPFVQLKGKNKKFDQSLYDKYDQPARELIKEKLGDKVQDNPDIYAEDLVIVDPKCKYKYIELQVCTTWLGDKYPHPNPYVYERKGSFSKDTLFIILDKNMEKGLLFDKESLNKEPKRIKKYSRTYIYEAPWHRVIKIYFEHFDMETIYEY